MARPSPQTDRVVALVELLSLRPAEGVTLAEATRRLGINKSTCHSMLTALTSAGWLLRDPFRKTYRLGPGLVAVGRAAGEGFPALEFARSALEELSAELGLNCAALAVADDHATVLDQARDLRAAGPGLHAGTVLPVRPPFGAVAVAWGDPSSWLAAAPEERRPRYAAALDAIRSRGYGVEVTPAPIEQLRRLVDQLDMPHLLERLADEDEYLVGEVDPAREYPVTAINTAVRDGAGATVLVLALTGFPAPLSGADVAAVGERLVSSAQVVEAAVAAAQR